MYKAEVQKEQKKKSHIWSKNLEKDLVGEFLHLFISCSSANSYIINNVQN